MGARRVSAAVVVAALMWLAIPASASELVTGTGQTKRSASLGFVASADRSGEMQYISESGVFKVHCTRYSSFESSETDKGFPRVTVEARKCFRPNGAQRFLRAVFVDRGEPGIGIDIVRMRWSRTWPVTAESTIRHDAGRIVAGEVQIH